MKTEEQTMNELSRLCVKIGTFFSNCDGSFEASEREFLECYVQNVDSNLKPTFDVKALVEEETNNRSSFDEVVNATNEFLSKFDENERTAIRGTLSVLIDKIINVDGKVHPNETKYFELWKKEVI
jgi:hypothetical protein